MAGGVVSTIASNWLDNMPRKEKHWGIVIDNRDPAFRGRLTVQCDTIAEGDVLEWIEPCFHFVDSDSQTSAGSFWVPNPGAIVEVEIEAEEDSEVLDLDPRWKCCMYSEGQVPEEFIVEGHYPNRRGWKTRAGHLFYFDDTENSLTFYYEHPSGTTLLVNNDGEIHIGLNPTEALVHGDILKTFLTEFRLWLHGHVHDATTITAPVGGGLCSGVTGKLLGSPSIPTDLLSEKHKVE